MCVVDYEDRSHPLIAEKKWERPKALEKVNLSSLKKHKIPEQLVATDNFLWLTHSDHVEIMSSNGVTTREYKSLDKPKRKVSVHHAEGFLSTSGFRSTYYNRIWHIGSEVILLMESRLYHFKENGTLIKITKMDDKWRALQQGEYVKYNWTVEFDNGAQLRFGHRKKMPKNNRRIPRKKITTDAFAFSGPWVLIAQSDWDDRKGELKKLVLLERRTAKTVAEFKYWEREKYKARYGVRIHEQGLYIDRLTDEYTLRKKVWPVRWFGEKVVDLNHGPDVFCYVFKGAKKCIDNAEHQLRDVVEMDDYRVLQTKDNLYIEGFSKTK